MLPKLIFKYLIEKPEEIKIKSIENWENKGINMDVNAVFSESGQELIVEANKMKIPLSVYIPMTFIETKELICLLKAMGIRTIICNTISMVFNFNEWAK